MLISPDPLGGPILENMDLKAKVFENQNAQMHLSHPFSVQLNVLALFYLKYLNFDVSFI